MQTQHNTSLDSLKKIITPPPELDQNNQLPETEETLEWLRGVRRLLLPLTGFFTTRNRPVYQARLDLQTTALFFVLLRSPTGTRSFVGDGVAYPNKPFSVEGDEDAEEDDEPWAPHLIAEVHYVMWDKKRELRCEEFSLGDFVEVDPVVDKISRVLRVLHQSLFSEMEFDQLCRAYAALAGVV